MAYEIGAKIRYYRELKGLSQKELADLIGVSNSRLGNWERGINRPDVDQLTSICKALQVSPNRLLDIQEKFSDLELRIVTEFRKKKELQHAIKILLGIES